MAAGTGIINIPDSLSLGRGDSRLKSEGGCSCLELGVSAGLVPFRYHSLIVYAEPNVWLFHDI